MKDFAIDEQTSEQVLRFFEQEVGFSPQEKDTGYAKYELEEEQAERSSQGYEQALYAGFSDF